MGNNSEHKVSRTGTFGSSGMVWVLSKCLVEGGKAYMSLYLGGHTFNSEVFKKESITDTIQDLEIELNNGCVYFEHADGNTYSYELPPLEDNRVQVKLFCVQGDIIEWETEVVRTYESLEECLKHLKEQKVILW